MLQELISVSLIAVGQLATTARDDAKKAEVLEEYVVLEVGVEDVAPVEDLQVIDSRLPEVPSFPGMLSFIALTGPGSRHDDAIVALPQRPERALHRPDLVTAAKSRSSSSQETNETKGFVLWNSLYAGPENRSRLNPPGQPSGQAAPGLDRTSGSAFCSTYAKRRQPQPYVFT